MVEDAISNEFIKQHYAGLYHLLHRHIRDPNITQEILQEAVATAIAHSRAGRVSDPKRLGGYVYRVALNLYRNYRREYANRPGVHATDEDVDQLPAQRVSDEATMDGSVMRHVVSIIESLPTARDREIVKRFYLDEEDKDQICQSLGLTPLHFDRVIFRARQRMRLLMAAKGFDKSDFFSVLLSLLH
ncbi:RNA polymerase sigma factor [Peristeroidobacter soli]|uniref:RNA polymerase sigma factor n=1 Tax=Peristeroidobacter soli TaxID=2497877 RepID=UPI001300AD52|nr:sigma-70 family RNA polymerase sigma factor [Peristeroidobacter soli]